MSSLIYYHWFLVPGTVYIKKCKLLFQTVIQNCSNNENLTYQSIFWYIIQLLIISFNQSRKWLKSPRKLLFWWQNTTAKGWKNDRKWVSGSFQNVKSKRLWFLAASKHLWDHWTQLLISFSAVSFKHICSWHFIFIVSICLTKCGIMSENTQEVFSSPNYSK